jgi:phospholipid/cholesterol/gamma-HCH transport system substrate-binding protein
MTETRLWDRIRLKIHALLLIAIVVSVGGIAAAAYNHAFTSSIPVTLQASRAGLQMHAGNRVQIRGVDLGLVDEVNLNPDQTGVTIVMRLNPKLAEQVPVNVTASLDQLTAFGNKTVQLSFPTNPVTQTLRAGSVINAQHVTTEVNNAFDQLVTVLNEVQPAKLNATLGAFAQTLQGRGDSIGVTLTKADQYLNKFNRNLPALQDDFRISTGFSNVYADVAPDLVELFGNAGTTAATLADKRTDFPGLLSSLHNLGGEADDFFAENADPLTNMLKSLRPTTSLLKQYSPALTCFLDGTGVSYRKLNKLFNENGLPFDITFAPGSGGSYQYPKDLPRIGPGPEPGPNCRGLPVLTGEELGETAYTSDPPDLRGRSNSPLQVPHQPAVVQFFGPRALLPPETKGGN